MRKQASPSERLSSAVLAIVAAIPESRERPSSHPEARAQLLAERAARSSARISGLAALVPGPLGLLTVLPDLIALWRIQSQLVADIAAVYGYGTQLDASHMLWCLFQQEEGRSARELAMRMGERMLIRPWGLRVLRNGATRAGLKLSQRSIGALMARALPLVGSACIAGYAYFDTHRVAKSATALFAQGAPAGHSAAKPKP